MAIRVNFTDIGNFDPIPANTYPCVVTDAELKDSQTSEFQYIKLELTVKEGEYENRRLFQNLTLNPKGAFKMREAMVAFGMCDPGDESEHDIEVEDFIGGECNAVVVQSSYQGKLTNNITALLMPGEVDISAPLPEKNSGAQTTGSAGGRTASGGTSARSTAQRGPKVR